MMTQTLALLLDAYRELNAKKMFCVVLVLSVVVMAAFALLGVNDHTLTILGREPLGDLRNAGLSPMTLYKTLFSTVVVGFWLTWLAALLALISTAGIFPDFLSSGAIDLYLAKPISRVRLFFTKYLAGLLFVTLQVTLFSFLSFLILGIRAGLWQPGLFMAIPLVVVFFSYLFAICTFFGVWTRSTVAALLLTLLAWFGIFGIDYVERQMNTFRNFMEVQQETVDLQIGAIDRRIAQLRAAGTMPGDALPANNLQALEERKKDLAARRDRFDVSPGLATAQHVLYGIKTFIPKTRETTNLLDRVLFSDKDLQQASRHTDESDEALLNEALSDARPMRGPRRRGPDMTTQLRLDRERSPLWILGTSLVFEAVVLGTAAWMFNRRDF
jgi:hypothetical protein